MATVNLNLAVLEQQAPELVGLAKSAAETLQQRQLFSHTARIALCLDISSSMEGFYISGIMDHLIKRTLGLALNLTDDSLIDIFLFGKSGYRYGEVGLGNYRNTIKGIKNSYPFEYETNYSKALSVIQEHYFAEASTEASPVFVFFATDGDTTDKEESRQIILDSAGNGIFWQFMAIGKPRKKLARKILGSDFAFLEELPQASESIICNTSFFRVEDPSIPTDKELYENLLNNYPEWVMKAKELSLI